MQLAGGMPAGLVEHDDRMRVWGKAARDLVEMMRHGLGVGVRHDNRRPGAALGTDRTKQTGRFGARLGQARGLVPRAPSAGLLGGQPPRLVAIRRLPGCRTYPISILIRTQSHRRRHHSSSAPA